MPAQFSAVGIGGAAAPPIFQNHSSERGLQPHLYLKAVIVKPRQYLRPSYGPAVQQGP